MKAKQILRFGRSIKMSQFLLRVLYALSVYSQDQFNFILKTTSCNYLLTSLSRDPVSFIESLLPNITTSSLY